MTTFIQAHDKIYFQIDHQKAGCLIIVTHNKTRSIQVLYQNMMAVQIIHRIFSYLGKYNLYNHHVYISKWFRKKNPNLTRKASQHTFTPFNTSLQLDVIRLRNTSQLHTGLL